MLPLVWYTISMVASMEKKDVQIRIWDSTKAMIDFLCQEDKRTIAAELDVVLAQIIDSRGIDPLTLTPKPEPAAQPAETAP